MRRYTPLSLKEFPLCIYILCVPAFKAWHVLRNLTINIVHPVKRPLKTSEEGPTKNPSWYHSPISLSPFTCQMTCYLFLKNVILFVPQKGLLIYPSRRSYYDLSLQNHRLIVLVPQKGHVVCPSKRASYLSLQRAHLCPSERACYSSLASIMECFRNMLKLIIP